jgi:uncharacterized protein (DUF1499 family)
MRILKVALLVLLAVPLLVLLAARLGAFESGTPTDLGVTDGRLKPPAVTPNSVSSQAELHAGHPMQREAQIAPLPLVVNGPVTLESIKIILQRTPGARVVSSRPDYLYVQFKSPWMRFVDDAEFWYDPVHSVVQVRSASRLGRSDMGVNRARIEAIREQLEAL